MGSVLLTNGLQRKTLACVRSLGAHRIETSVAETTRLNPASFSRHAKHSLRSPSPLDPSFPDWLLGQVRSNRYKVLFPMDDDVIATVLAHRAELEAYCHIPLPPKESYMLFRDKASAAKRAAAVGVPAPATVLPHSAEDAAASADALGYPLVVKARTASGSRGLRVVNDARAFLAAYEAVHADYPFPLLQEWVPSGVRYDVCLLYDRQHRLRATFTQKEVRHFPLPSGPSTVQESVHAPELVEMATALLDGLDWVGVAEAEFMYDARKGCFLFMEVNPRFWNSLHLAVLTGIDFPWLLYQVAVGGELPQASDYPDGIRCRSILPSDALHFLANPDRLRLDPPFFSGGKRGGFDDIISIADPGPTLGFLLAAARLSFDRTTWKALFDR